MDQLKQLEIVTEISGIQIVNVEEMKNLVLARVAALSGQVNDNKCIEFTSVNLCDEGLYLI